MTQEITKGRLLAIDTGSTSTKLGYFIDGKQVFSEKLIHNMEELSRYENVMDQDRMRRDAIIGFLRDKGIAITDIDIVMARGGLFAPVITGVYKVNRDMRDVLLTCRDGVHACNLSAVIADDIAEEVNEARSAAGTESPFGLCRAYIADPPMADEMLPECRLGGIPEFPHRAFFHALNSRATVKQYLRSHGKEENDITAIVESVTPSIVESPPRFTSSESPGISTPVLRHSSSVNLDASSTPEAIRSSSDALPTILYITNCNVALSAFPLAALFTIPAFVFLGLEN